MWTERCLLPGLVFLLAGCAGGPPPEQVGPVETYLAWHEAVAGGDWARAVQLLDPEVVEVFRGVGRELAEAVGSRAEPLDIFQRSSRTEVASPLRSVKVVRQEGEAAIVRVLVGECPVEAAPGPGCLAREVRVVRREGRFWIQPELPAALRVGVAEGEEVKP